MVPANFYGAGAGVFGCSAVGFGVGTAGEVEGDEVGATVRDPRRLPAPS